MDNGDVYAFGSNQFGQLGTGDTAMRSVDNVLLCLFHIADTDKTRLSHVVGVGGVKYYNVLCDVSLPAASPCHVCGCPGVSSSSQSSESICNACNWTYLLSSLCVVCTCYHVCNVLLHALPALHC